MKTPSDPRAGMMRCSDSELAQLTGLSRTSIGRYLSRGWIGPDYTDHLGSWYSRTTIKKIAFDNARRMASSLAKMPAEERQHFLAALEAFAQGEETPESQALREQLSDTASDR